MRGRAPSLTFTEGGWYGDGTLNLSTAFRQGACTDAAGAYWLAPTFRDKPIYGGGAFGACIPGMRRCPTVKTPG